MLKTIVKISNITNLSDARYCAGMGVEMLGFSMDSLAIERFNEIRNWVSGVQIVGETKADTWENVSALLAQYKPDVLQVSNAVLFKSKPDTMGNLPLICSFDVSMGNIEAEIASAYQTLEPDYCLLESSDEFMFLEPDTLNQLNSVASRYPVLIGFGIKESNVNDILKDLTPCGIALYGSNELRPGYKDFGEMMNILEVLEED